MPSIGPPPEGFPPRGKLRLSKKVCSPLGPLCEGAPPAGGGGENCTAVRNISGYGKVLSLRPFGAPPSQREVFRHAGLPPSGEAVRRSGLMRANLAGTAPSRRASEALPSSGALRHLPPRGKAFTASRPPQTAVPPYPLPRSASRYFPARRWRRPHTAACARLQAALRPRRPWRAGVRR